MDDNRLRQLLNQTDQSAETPGTGDLVGGAIRRGARRRRNAIGPMGAGVIGAGLLAVLIAIHLGRPAVSSHHVGATSDEARSDVTRNAVTGNATTGNVTTGNVTKSEELAMAIQLDVATRTVDGLLRREHEQMASQHLQRLEQQRFILLQEREVAARDALASAAELADGGRAAVLRLIVRCYSGTGAAIVAQERLSTIQ